MSGHAKQCLEKRIPKLIRELLTAFVLIMPAVIILEVMHGWLSIALPAPLLAAVAAPAVRPHPRSDIALC